MFLDLKKELETSIAAASPSYIDSPARRVNGKVFFRNRELHDFSCLDVLGLSQNKRVKRAAHESIEALGLGTCRSRKNAGTSSAHIICEKALSSFFGYERSLVFSGRNQVVFSLLATLLREQDHVFCDEDYAGLLSDVCLLLNCPLEVLPLNNPKSLEAAIEVPLLGKRKVLFADSISATSGRKLDLISLSLLCARHNVLLIVDESYAAGILGPRGAGVMDESDFVASPTRPFCLISELGFGLGVFGACLSGTPALVDALALRSRTLAVEPSLPPTLAASIAAGLDVCELSFAQRALIKGKCQYLLGGLLQIKHSLDIIANSFVSVRFKKRREAVGFLDHLFLKGFLCDLLPSPTKFSESTYVRMIPTVWHSDRVLTELLNVAVEFFQKPSE